MSAKPAPKDDALTTARAALAAAILETDATEPFGDALDDGIPTDHGRQVWAHRLALEVAANPQRAQETVGRYVTHLDNNLALFAAVVGPALVILAEDVLAPILHGDNDLAVELAHLAADLWRTPTREDTP